jgi:hypothetical protein
VFPKALAVQWIGTSRLKFYWNGHSVLKFPDANGQLRIRELFQTMVRLHGRSQPIADLHLSGLLIELFSRQFPGSILQSVSKCFPITSLNQYSQSNKQLLRCCRYSTVAHTPALERRTRG